MSELFLVIAGTFLAVTIAVTFEYCRILRRTQKEYEKAKWAVEEIVLSFGRQLKKDMSNIERLAFKVEAVSSTVREFLGQPIETKIAKAMEDKLVSIGEELQKANTRLGEAHKQICDTIASQEALVVRINVLEEQVKRAPISIQQDAEAVIPFKRDRAIAPLTPTELNTLDFLINEGPKTAPEVKWKIRLSREHTARLMKKLYEGGYLERDTSKIPFRYSVKKEMEELLKKV